jgi:hypothetical protein
MPRYSHAEAYMLMTYRSDDGTEQEQVFNSRDGVTPFVIALRSGKPATHADWAADTRMPEDWAPPAGMRYFADMTRDRARELAGRNITGWLADPEKASYFREAYGDDRDRAAEVLAAQYFQPGAPDLIDPAADGTPP